MLLTGRALSYATAGLRPAASYRTATDYYSGNVTGGRFRFTQVPCPLYLAHMTAFLCSLVDLLVLSFFL